MLLWPKLGVAMPDSVTLGFSEVVNSGGVFWWDSTNKVLQAEVSGDVTIDAQAQFVLSTYGGSGLPMVRLWLEYSTDRGTTWVKLISASLRQSWPQVAGGIMSITTHTRIVVAAGTWYRMRARQVGSSSGNVFHTVKAGQQLIVAVQCANDAAPNYLGRDVVWFDPHGSTGDDIYSSGNNSLLAGTDPVIARGSLVMQNSPAEAGASVTDVGFIPGPVGGQAAHIANNVAGGAIQFLRVPAPWMPANADWMNVFWFRVTPSVTSSNPQTIAVFRDISTPANVIAKLVYLNNGSVSQLQFNWYGASNSGSPVITTTPWITLNDTNWHMVGLGWDATNSLGLLWLDDGSSVNQTYSGGTTLFATDNSAWYYGVDRTSGTLAQIAPHGGLDVGQMFMYQQALGSGQLLELWNGGHGKLLVDRQSAGEADSPCSYLPGGTTYKRLRVTFSGVSQGPGWCSEAGNFNATFDVPQSTAACLWQYLNCPCWTHPGYTGTTRIYVERLYTGVYSWRVTVARVDTNIPGGPQSWNAVFQYTDAAASGTLPATVPFSSQTGTADQVADFSGATCYLESA